MNKILISACLLGQKVRYDGGDNANASDIIAQWQSEGRLVPVCPEVAGGLGTPRPPAEIQRGDGGEVLRGDAQVMTIGGDDVTAQFLAGAHAALALAQEHGCKYALLKARSPSCGSSRTYDGTHTGHVGPGMGVTTALLRTHGIEVFSEEEIETLASVM